MYECVYVCLFARVLAHVCTGAFAHRGNCLAVHMCTCIAVKQRSWIVFLIKKHMTNGLQTSSTARPCPSGGRWRTVIPHCKTELHLDAQFLERDVQDAKNIYSSASSNHLSARSQQQEYLQKTEKEKTCAKTEVLADG